MTEKTFKFTVNKDKIKARQRLAEEFEAKKKQAQEELLTEQRQEAAFQKAARFKNHKDRKTLLRENHLQATNERLQFLKEYTSAVVADALPIDADEVERYREPIQKAVFEYFDQNSTSSLAKSIADLTNPTRHYQSVIIGGERVDSAIMSFFEMHKEHHSYKGMDPTGRITANDFLEITDRNTDADLAMKPIQEGYNKSIAKVASAVKSKILNIMKEEAEISEAANYLAEGMKEDPAFELKNKPFVRLAEKNTLFREVFRNTKVLNEYAEGSDEQWLAEAILNLTIMETMNTLFLESLTTEERIEKLHKERAAYTRSKNK